MYEEWMNLLPKILDNITNLEVISCPCCKKYKIDYLYIGNTETRIGYLQIWCSDCLNGIYVSRAQAPENAKMIDYEEIEKRDKIIPGYKFINP